METLLVFELGRLLGLWVKNLLVEHFTVPGLRAPVSPSILITATVGNAVGPRPTQPYLDTAAVADTTRHSFTLGHFSLSRRFPPFSR